MISSFFNKTKPINYVVLSTFLVLLYGLYHFYGPSSNEDSTVSYFLETLTLVTLLAEMFLINEIVRREKVTSFSSYAMLFFVLLLVVFPESLMDKKVVFCNFFLLLSLWRLLSVKSIKNVKHKIFDASFFIGVASLFVDWALAYLLLVFLVINLYDRKTFKNWVVPFIAIIALGILTFALLQLYDSVSFLENHYLFPINFLNEDFTAFKMMKPIFYSVIILIVMTLAFLKQRQKGGGKLLVLRILFSAFVLSTLVMFFNSKHLGTALLGFFPASIFMTNYLESFKQNRYKEVAIVILLFIPFFILGVQLSS